MEDWTKLIKDRLDEIGMTQAQLGERLTDGKTQGGVGHWLNRKRQPKFEVLIEIADITGLDRAALGAALLEAKDQAYIARTPFDRAVLESVSIIPTDKRERFLGWLEAKLEDFLEPDTPKKQSAAAAKSA